MLTKEKVASALLRNRRVEISQEVFPDFLRAAVLVPLFPERGDLSVILTVRTNDVETHKGQISFPGGTRDESDADSTHTAVRELEEELGIAPTKVEILGLLDDLATPTGFIITPVIGYMEEEPQVTPNRSEVAETIVVSLSFFADEKNARWEMGDRDGSRMKVWFYQYGEYLIWGATAAIIRNLIEVVAIENA